MTEPRLFIEADLKPDQPLTLTGNQHHYLAKVLRLGAGATVKLFNGRDGEWQGIIDHMGRRETEVVPGAQLRPQMAEPDLWLLFAPIKGKRVDAIAEKAGELGVSRIQPVLTRRTVVSRVNVERLQANALEAAEQCERLSVPEVAEPRDLPAVLEDWPGGRRLYLADERADATPIATALAAEASRTETIPPAAVLIGPEGGFEEAEKQMVRALPDCIPVSLGPRLLRADTAVFATLALWQAHLGDWRGGDNGWPA
ncbi:MAG: 16S rRNA (uracil(1498)-N(3))-methyltransferase [Minwuia sp.]|nr:16S rRNA (uracil(1498)-N(3))-methyltransferase [Minwuia sp.]